MKVVSYGVVSDTITKFSMIHGKNILSVLAFLQVSDHTSKKKLGGQT